MSDRPEDNQPAPASAGGWVAPPDAENIPDTPPSKSTDVPLPGTTPAQSGAWFTPSTPAPAKPTAPNLPQGSALSSDVNYDNYVPGVGFVSKGTPAAQPASVPSPAAPGMAVPDLAAPPGDSSPVTVDSIPIPPEPKPILDQTASDSSATPAPNIGPAASLPVIPGLNLDSTGAPVPSQTEPVIPVPQPQPAPPPLTTTPAAPVAPAATITSQEDRDDREAPPPTPLPAAPVQATPAQPAPASSAPEPLTADAERAAAEAALKRPEVPKAAPISTTPTLNVPTQEELAAEPLPQRYVDVEQAVQALRRRYAVGRISRDQLQAELRKLMILDDDGHWWMIGLETDRWYKYDGRDWQPAEPAGRSASGGHAPTGRAAGTGTLGKPVVLGKPAVKSDETRRYAIPDEQEEPLPQRVPLDDVGATVVGRAAPRLDQNLGGAAAYGSGVTVPSRAVDVTQVGTPVAGYQDTVPAPAPGLDQPDYGPKPSGLMSDRQRTSRYLIIGALVVTFLVLAGTLIAVIGGVLYYSSIVGQYSQKITDLPQTVQAVSQSVMLFDVNGNSLSTRDDPNLGKHIYVPLDQISQAMIAATIATEDQRFYDNPGFDVVGIVRAVLTNLRSGTASSGASTITQELVRAQVLEAGAANDRSSARKIKEIFVASEVARRYSKSQILEYYLNTVNYGNLAYGVEAAANTYFNKHAKDLDIAESAFLAGMVQAPALYDP
ncbi:MAG TPA: transglycosylase domain-containing protein, partial [Aggregatilineales bacterium]|nr:transglycosylase domain-containing protein [Aggregatilineales bacterium]